MALKACIVADRATCTYASLPSTRSDGLQQSVEDGYKLPIFG